MLEASETRFAELSEDSYWSPDIQALGAGANRGWRPRSGRQPPLVKQ